VSARSSIDVELLEHESISFGRFQELALYAPVNGFYEGIGAPANRRDYVTSVSLGSTFAKVVANAVDRWWHECGTPSRFWFIEAGAGSGVLVRNLASIAPQMQSAQALCFATIERSEAMRRLQASTLSDLPEVQVLAGFPAEGFDAPGVVFANEVLDNICVDVLCWSGSEWQEVRVRSANGELVEYLAPATDFDKKAIEGLVAAEGLRPGARVPVQTRSRTWVGTAQHALLGGVVVAIDYGRTTAEMAQAHWGEWLRTYRRHKRGASPYASPGEVDITCDVAVDQLRSHIVTTQAEFLKEHGIGAIREDAARSWKANAANGGLQALEARSTVHEADALVDPAGLGGFKVMQWPVAQKRTDR
jgi:SAM-dependent MidA family methyltransferase